MGLRMKNFNIMAKKMEEWVDTTMHTMNLAVTLTAILVY